MIEVQTRKSLVLTLDRAGITGPAADLMIRESAPARAESRVLATLAAAAMADLDGDPATVAELAEAAARQVVRAATDPTAPQRLDGRAVPDMSTFGDLTRGDWCEAWAVLSLDLAGVGGHGGYSGDGTVRHPCFRRLGSGRKHASDGGAWLAAAEQARILVQAVLDLFGCNSVRFGARRPTPLDGETLDEQPWLLSVVWGDGPDDWAAMSHEIHGDLAWQQAECARQLVAAAKTPNGLEDAAPWANLYNRITRSILDAQEKANAAAEAANQATAKILADMDKSDAAEAAQ